MRRMALTIAALLLAGSAASREKSTTHLVCQGKDLIDKAGVFDLWLDEQNGQISMGKESSTVAAQFFSSVVRWKIGPEDSHLSYELDRYSGQISTHYIAPNAAPMSAYSGVCKVAAVAARKF